MSGIGSGFVSSLQLWIPRASLVVNIVASKHTEALQWPRDRLVSTDIKHSVSVAELASLGSTDVGKGKQTRGKSFAGASILSQKG
jgi:hypothetical protein